MKENIKNILTTTVGGDGKYRALHSFTIEGKVIRVLN
jgi:hypothetical protein